MLLSRKKPAKRPSQSPVSKEAKQSAARGRGVLSVRHYIDRRDYGGALTLLEFERASAAGAQADADLWIAYCAFHTGDYEKARDQYEALLASRKPYDPRVRTWLACCLYMLGEYERAAEAAKQGPDSPLANRILFHAAQKADNEELILSYHRFLKNVVEDQMTLAAIHYMRTHYAEAIDVYKDLGVANPQFVALKVYMAMCYYKRDMFDPALELVSDYLKAHPDSLTALNLRACITYGLGGEQGSALAAAELARAADRLGPGVHFGSALLQHNRAVFQGGEAAVQTWLALSDRLGEASINLALYYLRVGEPEKARRLVEHLATPSKREEYLVLALVQTEVGQSEQDARCKKAAFDLFQTLGQSLEEKDTKLGRQCMASCFFLLHQFDSVVLYLDSIRDYSADDDVFNYNYGQAKAALGAYDEAEAALVAVRSPAFTADYTYLCHLARCYIVNGKPHDAWALYVNMDMSAESFSVLNLIANDCYKAGEFYHAARAFDVLERFEPDSAEYWEGKRGACVGLFRALVDKLEPREHLNDLLVLLQNSAGGHAQEVAYIDGLVRRWAQGGL